MIRSDFHCHTYYCDGKDSPEAMAEQALSLGMDALGFSGHSYAPYDPDCCMSKENTLKYRRDIDDLKTLCSGKLKIYCGIEQDIFAPAAESEYDYSIGSVHYLKRNGVYVSIDYMPSVTEKLCDEWFYGDIYALCSEYYSNVAEVYERTGCSIIGHFDLVSKFNESGAMFDESHPSYVQAWQSAADRLIKFGIPFEINTGAMSRGYRSTPYPSAEIIAYLSSRGASFVLSSDSHRKENLMYKFGEIEEQLGKKGINIGIFRP